MTGKVKGQVAAVSHLDAKTKAQKIADKATKATENMHRIVTASLDQLQHAAAAPQIVSHEGKTGTRKKAGAGTKKAPHHSAKPMKKM
jgi:hypothetical protein